jgi:hypothetical protein
MRSAENRTLQELLTTYEIETSEIVSVTIGKKQKRTKKYAWEQEFPEDLKTQIARATSGKAAIGGARSARSPRSPRSGPSTPSTPGKDRDRTEGEAPKSNRKRAEGGRAKK